MRETRRLAAIMAVDVVGYSRLMGEDEAGTAKAVREHRKAAAPIVAGLGGRVVKTMGDGVLLEFPSVVAAVECAVTIQNMMVERNVDTPEARRIVYRIGVHLGDVLIDGDDILGEGVNIAARLESICEPSCARARSRFPTSAPGGGTAFSGNAGASRPCRKGSATTSSARPTSSTRWTPASRRSGPTPTSCRWSTPRSPATTRSGAPRPTRCSRTGRRCMAAIS